MRDAAQNWMLVDAPSASGNNKLCLSRSMQSTRPGWNADIWMPGAFGFSTLDDLVDAGRALC